MDSEVRKKAWPLLLNIDTKTQERRTIEREEALENEFLSTKETHWKSTYAPPPHPRYAAFVKPHIHSDRLKKDINRSLFNLTSTAQYTRSTR